MFSLREPFAIVIAGLVASLGCKARATPADCDALVRHFAEVSAKESGLDPASPEVRKVVLSAKDDPDALACSSELEVRQVRCALSATTTEAILGCLER
ncbi:MAG: hypothetical protein IPK71_34490 [Myxococcales bacterium]|nr:hypothetical protein [Myxococcales bacterium]MBL9110530.1 hypothetical protein [Myxococcales bacterium]